VRTLDNSSAAAPINTGRSEWVLRGAAASLRIDRRVALAQILLGVLLVLTGAVALGAGDIMVSIPEVIATFGGNAPAANTLVVQEWRLPRIVLSVVLGYGLAVSGSVFQSLTRNPLGSPDIIGFTSGSYTGAILLLVVVHAPTWLVSLGALGSGLIVAIVVFSLSYRGGFRGFRLIVVGIGISAMLGAVNTWILVSAKQQVAMTAAMWGAGSLDRVPENSLPVAAIGVALCLGVILAASPAARAMELGEDTSRALGVPTRRLQVILIVAGVGLVALATAVAGPISFVALVAPQIAARMTGRSGWDPASAGLTGALLLLLSDTLGRVIFLPFQLPAGTVMVCVGGVYLVWLLIHEARRL
jgi:iron complex transport system permease protein